MVWVWPDTSAEGLEAAKVVKPNLMEDVDEKAMSYLVVCRDMPVSRRRIDKEIVPLILTHTLIYVHINQHTHKITVRI